MTNYIIKTEKIGERMYNHYLFDEQENKIEEEGTLLENGKTVGELLRGYHISIAPFMIRNNLDTSKLEIEVRKQ